MTPAGYLSYFVVHPDWQDAGIGSILLYLLIQKCPCDMTLHVSVNNTAFILYQKFGFKAEQFILNFYDKYVKDDNTSFSSKHAFFIRLRYPFHRRRLEEAKDS